jgi:PD-(D/E)XK nuclease superfamily protein
MDHPVDIGDRTTLAVMLVLRELGFAVLAPFGENTRYDLVVDDGESLRKVQCKTGRLRRGAVIWSMCSNYGHHPHPDPVRRDYHGEVDAFAVYCPETCGVYLMPIEDVPMRTCGNLRVAPPKNNQRKRIRFAEQYEIGRVHLNAGPPTALFGPRSSVYEQPTSMAAGHRFTDEREQALTNKTGAG